MYNSKSKKADEFICHDEIMKTLEFAKENKNNKELIKEILDSAKNYKGLTYEQVALLLECEDENVISSVFDIAADIKDKVYGKRVVFFAPLYLSNYCVNGCRYCSFHNSNQNMLRKKLNQEQIRKEAIALQDMGHKRLALEIGEDPVNNPIEYVIESIKTIYDTKHKNGEIRRVNVNIAATTVEDYKKLRDVGIGTYILFQETYHRPSYEFLHPKGPKHNYSYHTEAMDRAMEAGIDDVGLGALFGLYDFKYEMVALMMHAKHLEDTFGVGPHTISVPRIRRADDVDLKEYPNSVSDDDFKKIVAILRCAVPYTGMIVSTRESKEIRKEILHLGVSQLSGGSKTGIGGYCEENKVEENTNQFEICDDRSLDEVIGWLCGEGYIPSFCTACYREGRTGERFMKLAKNAQIGNICQPNALMTLKEYMEDYATPSTKSSISKLIDVEIEKIPNEKVLSITKKYMKNIENGERDFRL